MTIDELLQPRYKVIAGYPKSPYKVGDILSLPWDNSAWFGIICDGEYIDNIDHTHIKNIKPHPHLFKPLEWWEERRPGEMPEYVRFIATGAITLLTSGMIEMGGIVLEDYLPATESDYLTYKSIRIKNKTK